MKARKPASAPPPSSSSDMARCPVAPFPIPSPLPYRRRGGSTDGALPPYTMEWQPSSAGGRPVVNNLQQPVARATACGVLEIRNCRIFHHAAACGVLEIRNIVSFITRNSLQHAQQPAARATACSTRNSLWRVGDTELSYLSARATACSTRNILWRVGDTDLSYLSSRATACSTRNSLWRVGDTELSYLSARATACSTRNSLQHAQQPVHHAQQPAAQEILQATSSTGGEFTPNLPRNHEPGARPYHGLAPYRLTTQARRPSAPGLPPALVQLVGGPPPALVRLLRSVHYSSGPPQRVG